MAFPELQAMTTPNPVAGQPAIPFAAREDSAQFQEERRDPTIRKEFEGGFVVTRPRYTRPPARVITTGFTSISQLDYNLLMTYWNAKRGGSVSFPYTHPTTGETLTVRFLEPLRAKYVGMGNTRLWDVHGIKLETV
jgi:hypothetical protein